MISTGSYGVWPTQIRAPRRDRPVLSLNSVCGGEGVETIGTNDGDGQVHRGHDDTGARVSVGNSTIRLIFVG